MQPTSLDDGYFLQVHDVSMATESFSGTVTHERTSSSTPEVTSIVQDAPGRFRSIVDIRGTNRAPRAPAPPPAACSPS